MRKGNHRVLGEKKPLGAEKGKQENQPINGRSRALTRTSTLLPSNTKFSHSFQREG